MMENEDILYRPVLRGILPESALWDGSISLGRIMLLNEAIDVEEENKYRQSKALAEKARTDAQNQSRRRY